jgi:heme exporter protein A
MSDTTPLIALSRVTKRFGRQPVLREVSLELTQGDSLLLLGNNGAGKSTLLHLLSSVMRPSSGELRFRGRPYTRAGAEVRRAIGAMSHDSRFYADLTARENLRVFGTLYGIAGLPARIESVLAAVRLDAVPDVPVRTFSSGMLKRLGLARLQLQAPQVLLLDEPYSGLDQASLELMDEYLRQFRDAGGTTVLVTHQFTNGVGLCNCILIVDRGRVVYHQPASGLTAARCAALLAAHAGVPDGPPATGGA